MSFRYVCSLGPHLEKTIKMFTYDDQTSHGDGVSTIVGWSDQIFLTKQKINKKCSLVVVTIRSITVVVSCIYVKY